MDFVNIDDNSKVYPGEYLLHVPSKQVVVCGAFIKSENKITSLRAARRSDWCLRSNY